MGRGAPDRERGGGLRGRRGGVVVALTHGLWAFIRSYVLRRGFLDGRLGFVLALLDAQSSCTRYLKLSLDGAPAPHELPHPGGSRRPSGASEGDPGSAPPQ